MSRAFYFTLIAIAIFLCGTALFFEFSPLVTTPLISSGTQSQLSEVTAAIGTSTTNGTTTNIQVVTSSISHRSAATSTKSTNPKKSSNGAINSSSSSSDQIARIQSPYSTPPESFDQINTAARSALVNILCEPTSGSSLNPISGSGVIIDPRGIILTNAHVAQYVLLSESPQIDLKCFIRTGSPAAIQWYASVLYIPPVWVNQHVRDINQAHPTGTGEHDYALLYITGSANAQQLPAQFPYLPIDTRPAIGFPGDQVLVASYPAELVGGIATQYNLYAVSSVTTIKQLLTFVSNTPDVVSLGGVIEAQEGSSGGAIVNAWGRLIALIAATSDGTSTSNRDLHADSLSYINSDFSAQTGSTLTAYLQKDAETSLEDFTRNTASGLLQLYVQQLSPTQ